MKKKCIFFITTVVILIIAVSFEVISDKTNLVTKSNVPHINFPELAGGDDYSFEVFSNLTENKISKVEKDKRVNEYYVVQEIVDDNVIDKVKNKFNINTNVSNINENTITYGDDNKLMVNNNGCFYYFKKQKNDLNEITLTDEECKTLANKIVNELEIFPEGYTYYGIIYGTGYNINSPENIFTVSKEVVFTRKIDNTNVYGNSKVSIKLIDNGDIQSISVNYRDIESKESSDNIVSVEKALDKINNFEGFITVPDETTKIIIDDIKISYWEDSSKSYENNTIQPVYEFTGKAYNGNEKIGEFTVLEQIIE